LRVGNVGCCFPVSSSDIERIDNPTFSANFSCESPVANRFSLSTLGKFVAILTEKYKNLILTFLVIFSMKQTSYLIYDKIWFFLIYLRIFI